MALALLFPGQGAQHAAMLPWLDVWEPEPLALTAMRLRLGVDWRARLADDAWASSNAVAQVVMTGISLAAWEIMRPRLPVPAALAGLSVGEIAAACAAGVFDVADALELAHWRALLMDEAVAEQDTGLMAVSGGPAGWLARMCEDHQLAVAIRMGPGQNTVGGRRADLLRAQNDAVRVGASCQWLAVSLASHTHWLAPAVAPLAALLETLPMRAASAPLVSNYTGQALRHPLQIREALACQLAHTVLWDSCMDSLAERGVRCVLELGPGHALARAWNTRHPGIAARALEDFQHPHAAADWVAATLARG